MNHHHRPGARRRALGTVLGALGAITVMGGALLAVLLVLAIPLDYRTLAFVVLGGISLVILGVLLKDGVGL